MERAGRTKDGAPIFVDFAHTEDGLDKLLRLLSQMIIRAPKTRRAFVRRFLLAVLRRLKLATAHRLSAKALNALARKIV